MARGAAELHGDSWSVGSHARASDATPRTTEAAIEPPAGEPASGQKAHLDAAIRRLQLGTIDAARIAQHSLLFAGLQLPLVDFIVTLQGQAPHMTEVRAAAQRAALKSIAQLLSAQPASTFLSTTRATMRFSRELRAMGAPKWTQDLLADRARECVDKHLSSPASPALTPEMRAKVAALPDRIRAGTS